MTDRILPCLFKPTDPPGLSDRLDMAAEAARQSLLTFRLQVPRKQLVEATAWAQVSGVTVEAGGGVLLGEVWAVGY